MSEQKYNEKPEVYALRQDSGSWQISRRDFLKAAGIGAAALGAGLNSRLVRPASAEESLDQLCSDAPAHQKDIVHLLSSADGKYLASVDQEGNVKCWRFEDTALTGSYKNPFFSGTNAAAAGYVDGRSSVISSKDDELKYYWFPLDENSTWKTIFAKGRAFSSFSLDRQDRVYGFRNNEIHRLTVNGDKTEDEVLFSSSDGEQGVSLTPIENGRKLFAQFRNRFGILDTESGQWRELDGSCDVYAVLPGETAALVGEHVTARTTERIRLISLLSGETIWQKNLNEMRSESGTPKTDWISAAAVTPDGSYVLLLLSIKDKQTGKSDEVIRLIDPKDGTPVRSLSIGSGSLETIAVAGDGTGCAVARKKSILFLSLPDLKIVGCPVDLEEMKDNVKGIKISGTDPVTGKTVTYTLPCGSPIPAGAVCTCNCVAGSKPSCTCVGHTCSCHSHRSGGGGGGHYWHPN